MSDGTVVKPVRAGVTALVGPNNAGKSAALREIVVLLGSNAPTSVVKAVELEREGTKQEIEEWFSSSYPVRIVNGGPHYIGPSQLPTSAVADWTISGPPLLATTSSFFIQLLDGQTRLQLANPSTGFQPRSEAPINPIQRLFTDLPMEAKLSSMCKESFGVGVALDRLGGTSLPLHMGEPIGQIGDIELYNQTIAGYPPLEHQGDGIRSYVGILLAALASSHPIILVDEPEAFLHPPQARMLGKHLSRIATSGRQIIIATHSDDVIRGLLADPGTDVMVSRITRQGPVNPVAILESESVRDLWKDPLLRYSQVLSGMFHDGVVICEADADCRFYEAALDGLDSPDVVVPDLLFVHTGGKHRIPTVLRSLKGIGVPVAAIVDIDFLREKTLMQSVLELTGGDWAEVQADWNDLVAGVTSLTPQNPVGFVKSEIDALFSSHQSAIVTSELRKAIRVAIQGSDGWSILKRGGVPSLPPGDCTARALKLLARFASMGVLIVPVGELEGWDKTLGGHGPAWVADAIANESHLNLGSGIKDFLLLLVSYVTSVVTPP